MPELIDPVLGLFSRIYSINSGTDLSVLDLVYPIIPISDIFQLLFWLASPRLPRQGVPSTRREERIRERYRAEGAMIAEKERGAWSREILRQ